MLSNAAQILAENSILKWDPRPEDCRSPVIADLYRYWQHRRFPAGADLDPLAMKAALGNISLIEVQRAPLRFKLRLVGSYQAERLGLDPTGTWLDELPTPEYRQLLIRRLEELVARPMPLLVHNRQLMDDKWYDYEALWLPLAADGDTVDMVMACQVFADGAE